MKVLMAFFLLLTTTACSYISSTPSAETTTSSPANKSPANASPSSGSYIVQPGDLLTISVWKESDLQEDVTVRPDGGLNFPLVNDIITSGKTVEELRKEITAKLSKYVPDPVVTVIVKASLGYRIFVIGKVSKPGDYPAGRDVDVMQALTMAGGLTTYASENNIKILRRVNGELKAIPFKYSQVEKGVDLKQNIFLQGGDVVVVP